MAGIPLRPGGAGPVHAGLVDRRDPVDQVVHALAAVELGRLAQHAAARDLDVAHQGVEDQGGAADVERLLVAGRHPTGMEDHLRRVGDDLVHEGPQLAGGNAGVGLLPFRRRVPHRVAQVVHARHVALDEVLVVGLPLQDLVNDGQVQGVVAVGADLPVAGGLAGGDGGPRVDIGAAHPVRHRGHERLGLLDHQRFEEVAAVEHQMLGVGQVEDQPLVAEAVERAGRVVHVAAAAGVVTEIVRRAQRPQEGPGQVGERAAAVRQRNAAPAERLDRLMQLVGDVIQRLVPRHPPPPAAAPRARADQRRLRPLVVELERQAGRTLRAQARTQSHVVRIALQPGHPAVLDRHLQRAAHRAHPAHAVHRASARGVHTHSRSAPSQNSSQPRSTHLSQPTHVAHCQGQASHHLATRTRVLRPQTLRSSLPSAGGYRSDLADFPGCCHAQGCSSFRPSRAPCQRH